MSKVYVDDLGTLIQLDVGEDINTASTIEIKVKEPDGTEVTWSATESSGDSNVIEHTIVAEDIDQPGSYLLQAHIVLGTWTGVGETAQLQVHEKFK
jgi:hypothetical protein